MSRPRTLLRRRGRKARNRVGAPDILWLALRRCGNGPSWSNTWPRITAIDLSAAGRAADEVLCVALGVIAHSAPEDGAAGECLAFENDYWGRGSLGILRADPGSS